MPGRDRSDAPIGLRTNDSPMPSVGWKSRRITSSRVAALTGPPRSRYAVVSVIDAPPPSNAWYLTFSLTVTVFDAPGLLAANATGACCCRPRVTVRPPESDVVVSQTFTCSLAAYAGEVTADADT